MGRGITNATLTIYVGIIFNVFSYDMVSCQDSNLSPSDLLNRCARCWATVAGYFVGYFTYYNYFDEKIKDDLYTSSLKSEF